LSDTHLHKQVAVVICNYNKKDFVIDCIRSVFDSNFRGFDLIVVDNASTDGSAEAVREQYGDSLVLLVNDENLGGSGGFHRGMTYAMKIGYKYIHLLDNDAIVARDAIGALYEFMETHPDAGVCGSLILQANNGNVVQEYGANLNGLDVDLLYRGKSNLDDLPRETECDYVAACSAIYRTEALNKTGAIPEDYFIYWDDLALCFEMKARGYGVYACKNSIVRHFGTFSNRSSFSRYYSFRNKIHCLTKYLSDEEFEKLPDMLVTRLFRMFAVNLHNSEIIATYLYALDDALNNVRGKATDYKLAQQQNKRALPLGIEVVQVPHVLDVERYNHSKVYTDPYQNLLFGEDDFVFVENLESNKEFFSAVYRVYVEGKLRELRKMLRWES